MNFLPVNIMRELTKFLLWSVSISRPPLAPILLENSAKASSRVEFAYMGPLGLGLSLSGM